MHESTPTPSVAVSDHLPAPRWPAWLRVLVPVGIEGVSYAVVFGVYFVLGKVLPQEPVPGAIGMFLGLVIFTLTVVGLLAWYLKVVERRPLSFSGLVFTRWTLPALVAGIVVSGIIEVICIWGIPASALAPADPIDRGPVPVALVVLFAFGQAFFLQGFPEELLFRGYIVKTLAARPWVAISTSVLFFTVLHLFSNSGQATLLERFTFLLDPFGFAVAAVGLALLTRSLWIAIGIHAGEHLAWMAAAPLGYGEGPALIYLRGALHLVVGVVALVLWVRRGTSIEYRY